MPFLVLVFIDGRANFAELSKLPFIHAPLLTLDGKKFLGERYVPYFFTALLYAACLLNLHVAALDVPVRSKIL
jgi:hypothetical protein